MKSVFTIAGVTLGFITLSMFGAGVIIGGGLLTGWLVTKVWRLDTSLTQLQKQLQRQKETLETRLGALENPRGKP